MSRILSANTAEPDLLPAIMSHINLSRRSQQYVAFQVEHGSRLEICVVSSPDQSWNDIETQYRERHPRHCITVTEGGVLRLDYRTKMCRIWGNGPLPTFGQGSDRDATAGIIQAVLTTDDRMKTFRVVNCTGRAPGN